MCRYGWDERRESRVGVPCQAFLLKQVISYNVNLINFKNE